MRRPCDSDLLMSLSAACAACERRSDRVEGGSARLSAARGSASVRRACVADSTRCVNASRALIKVAHTHPFRGVCGAKPEESAKCAASSARVCAMGHGSAVHSIRVFRARPVGALRAQARAFMALNPKPHTALRLAVGTSRRSHGLSMARPSRNGARGVTEQVAWLRPLAPASVLVCGCSGELRWLRSLSRFGLNSIAT
jgi:hypothetical protein